MISSCCLVDCCLTNEACSSLGNLFWIKQGNKLHVYNYEFICYDCEVKIFVTVLTQNMPIHAFEI